jgi:hypothetical protein
MRIERQRNLTADECDKIAEALRQNAAALPDEENETCLELAECFRDLAQMKRLVLRKVN